MNVLAAFAVGLLFGLGLIVSGMSDPAKVLAFLDLGGAWDPSLALVMGGAVAVGLIAYRVAGGRTASLLGEPMQIPPPGKVDKRPVMAERFLLPEPGAADARLLTGAALFGIGWGLAGICPGPALTLLGAGIAEGIVFVAAMLAGMTIFEIHRRRSSR
jgi:uncharacterized membrane protein YedE/YeeE